MDWYWIILIAGCLPLYFAAGWAYFGDWDGFLESVRYFFTPDIISILRGEWEDDQWAQLKLVFYVLTCAALVVGVHYLLKALVFS